jgi:hypothetical protein
MRGCQRPSQETLDPTFTIRRFCVTVGIVSAVFLTFAEA